MTVKNRKQTVRLCVAVFLATVTVLLMAAGAYTVDAVSGRLLHGQTYRPAVSTAVDTSFLPMRWQMLWAVLCGEWPFS